MQEVSCRAFGLFEGVAQELGFDVAELLVGTRLELAELNNPALRVDWDEWAILCDRFEEKVGGPEQTVRWGRTVPRRPFAVSLSGLTAHLFTAEQLYEAVARWFGPHLYRSHRWHCERLSGGRLRLVVRLLPGFRGSAAWFRITLGALEAAPTYLGLPSAGVTAEITPEHASYVIVVPPPLPLHRRMERMVRRLLSPGAALRELAALQAQVTSGHEALVRSNLDFRSALDQLQDAVLILKEDRIVFANRTFVEKVGNRAAEDVIGRCLADFVSPRSHALIGELTRPAADPTRRFLLEVDRADGPHIVLEAPALVAIRLSGEPALLFMARDVTEQHEAEAALLESEATNYALLEALPHVILRIERTGYIAAVTAGRRMALPFQADRLVGQNLVQMVERVAASTRDQVLAGYALAQAVCDDGRSRTLEMDVVIDANSLAYECEISRLDGSEVLVVVRDVTERRRMSAQLAMTDRLASLGTLAAGVAHEINNPLTYVLSNVDVIRNIAGTSGAIPPEERELLREAANEAYSGAERVRHIVRDLRTFARAPSNDEQVRVDVKAVLDGAVSIASNEIRHRARLIRRHEQVPAVLGSDSRLGQVFLNLLVNAAQAIPVGAADRNEIRVSTDTDAEGNVVIEIADSGPGIPAEIRDRIFDPFFSTKPHAVGTGLGLTICHDIVQRMGGHIEVATETGRGTTFRVVLPGAPPAPVPTPTPVPPLEESRRRARILIVDDEPEVARALARLVRRHDVRIARDGAEALRLIDERGDWDIIFCDVMMPVLSGVELYERIRHEHPELLSRLAFMTGGAFTDRARDLLLSVGAPKLEKPFDPDAVHAVVRRLLSEPPRSPDWG